MWNVLKEAHPEALTTQEVAERAGVPANGVGVSLRHYAEAGKIERLRENGELRWRWRKPAASGEKPAEPKAAAPKRREGAARKKKRTARRRSGGKPKAAGAQTATAPPAPNGGGSQLFDLRAEIEKREKELAALREVERILLD